MIGWFRLLWRSAALSAAAFVLYLVWMRTRRKLARDEPALRAERRRQFMRWNRLLARVIGMRLEMRGAPPDPPCILVTNHLSYIDVFVLGLTTGCVFIARGDAEHWPLIGRIMKSIHMMFIDRDLTRDTARVNALITHALAQRDIVALFAESRISRGRDVEAFKGALLQPAIAAGVPIHYATLTYKRLPGAAPPSRFVSWWRPEPFGLHGRRVLRNKGFVARITFGAAPVFHEDRRELAAELHTRVRAQFEPVD